jgi:putative transposase
MPRAYSEDLRGRVIDAVEIEGMSRRAAARRFGVSEACAVKWVQRWERHGDRRPVGTGGHRPSKTKPHRDWLLSVLSTAPDITLSALSARFVGERGVKATTGMLSAFFKSEDISFKKKRHAVRTRQAKRAAKAGKLEEISGQGCSQAPRLHFD